MDKMRFITVFEMDEDDKYANNGELIIKQLLSINGSLVFKPEYDKENNRFILKCPDGDEPDNTSELLKMLAEKDSGLKLTPAGIESLSDIKAAVEKMEKYLSTFFNGTFCPVKGSEANLRISEAENDLRCQNGQKNADKLPDNIRGNVEDRTDIKKYSDSYEYIMPYEDYFINGKPNITSDIVKIIREQTGYDELLEMHMSELKVNEPSDYTAYKSYAHKYPEMRTLGYAKDFTEAYFRLFNRLSPYDEENPVLIPGILIFDSFIRATLNNDLPAIS